jgi:hypothetical protein
MTTGRHADLHELLEAALADASDPAREIGS